MDKRDSRRIEMEEIEKRAEGLWIGLGVKSEVVKILQREYGMSQITAKGILRRVRRHLRAEAKQNKPRCAR